LVRRWFVRSRELGQRQRGNENCTDAHLFTKKVSGNKTPKSITLHRLTGPV
jgi:hypothetical protein